MKIQFLGRNGENTIVEIQFWLILCKKVLLLQLRKSANTIVPLFSIFALSLPLSREILQSSAATAILPKLVVDRYKCRYIVPAMYMPGIHAFLAHYYLPTNTYTLILFLRWADVSEISRDFIISKMSRTECYETFLRTDIYNFI